MLGGLTRERLLMGTRIKCAKYIVRGSLAVLVVGISWLLVGRSCNFSSSGIDARSILDQLIVEQPDLVIRRVDGFFEIAGIINPPDARGTISVVSREELSAVAFILFPENQESATILSLFVSETEAKTRQEPSGLLKVLQEGIKARRLDMWVERA